MTTAVSKLSAREALESSLSFAGDFIKRYWALVAAYVLVIAIPSFWMSRESVLASIRENRFQFDPIIIATMLGMVLIGMVLNLLTTYFIIRMALGKLAPSTALPDTS